MVLEIFRKSLDASDVVPALRAGLIGKNVKIPSPFGEKPLVYADYTASGRALVQVENFVAEHVLPYYANSHTESSFCGAYTTGLREEARRLIADAMNAGAGCSVIFSGSGATSGINRLVSLCGAGAADVTPVVFIGPFEHHSNILPWRECGAEVVEIGEDEITGIDLAMLERELQKRKGQAMLIGSFSAASNVTGILTDVDAVTQLLKQYGALAFWDYAGGGPYLSIDMNPASGPELDAVFLSPHKFPGGPGASGLLIIRDAIIRNKRPTWPGGGSVSYVSPWGHDYLENVCEREEAGTPNIIGDIRAALVFMIKAAVGQDFISQRDHVLVEKALAVWGKNPLIDVLAGDRHNRLPIFSFVLKDGAGGHLHHHLATRMLSDMTGIQARGGCACAGPYGHRLLGVDRALSEQIRGEVSSGEEIQKPGWVRLNLGYLLDDETVAYIIGAVDRFAAEAGKEATNYSANASNAQFSYRVQG